MALPIPHHQSFIPPKSPINYYILYLFSNMKFFSLFTSLFLASAVLATPAPDAHADVMERVWPPGGCSRVDGCAGGI
ncbi:hypothetical protein BV25DRAFT_1829411 [Artomyces pyxidatus]|uniref:Uncharacterized protein n=1 Tax=Artomyces pyxidatus TaxID=48021 RepID=A0ACB8SSZ7_9AGAM|nr:hypothetical protein BV25DRAFT_1829411 [Artomyces pyxidatus]